MNNKKAKEKPASTDQKLDNDEGLQKERTEDKKLKVFRPNDWQLRYNRIMKGNNDSPVIDEAVFSEKISFVEEVRGKDDALVRERESANKEKVAMFEEPGIRPLIVPSLEYALSPEFLPKLAANNFSFITPEPKDRERCVLVSTALQMVQALTADYYKEQLEECRKKNVVRNPDPIVAREVNSKTADEFALNLKDTILQLEQSGHTTLRSIAEQLTSMGIPTRTGKDAWEARTVKGIKDRLKNLNQ